MLRVLISRGYDPNVAEYGLVSTDYLSIEIAARFLSGEDTILNKKLHPFHPLPSAQLCSICGLDSSKHLVKEDEMSTP